MKIKKNLKRKRPNIKGNWKFIDERRNSIAFKSKSKESAVEEYFEHLSESAMEERNEQPEPKERRNTLPRKIVAWKTNYYNLASSDDEATSEDYILVMGGTYMGQTITPRLTRGNKVVKRPKKGKHRNQNQQQEKT
ncbi:hypothetical protein JTB14_003332 [Gonioctena quinquepunctata]|nr:hypothetical protein JTB14_003332 [Gonioctena quinquepunctata]